MPRYVAFLRGVTPANLKMADLKQALEHAGCRQVRTVLSSGNAAFDAESASGAALEPRLEAALAQQLGRRFAVVVRPRASLLALLQSDPFAGLALPLGSKRIVSFLKTPQAPRLPLPLTEGTATVIRQDGDEVFTAYLPSPEGPVFMKLIEQAFGTELTTRTWDTVARCAAA